MTLRNLGSNTIVLSTTYAARDEAFLGAHGGTLVLFDDFTVRPEGQTISQSTAGLNTPTGQGYKGDGLAATNSVATISGGRLAWTDETSHGATPVRITGCRLEGKPYAVWADAIFSDDSTDPANSANVVLGCCEESFATDSIQLAVWRDHWLLFSTGPDGVAGAYALTTLATGTFATPLATGIPLRVAMRYNPSRASVTIYVPGHSEEVSDAKITRSWGTRVCLQERRDVTGTLGHGSWLRWAATLPAPASSAVINNGGLVLTASKDNYVDTQQPNHVWTDLQVDFFGSPSSGSWVSGGNIALASIWTADTSQQSWALFVDSAGRLGLYKSADGATSSSTVGNVALPDGTNGLRLTYAATAGTLKVYTSADDGTTWTQLGSNRTFGVTGAPFAASAITRLRIATRDFSTAYTYGGTIKRVLFYDAIDGNVIADADFRSPWLGNRKTDPYGNTWQVRGSWSWTQPVDRPTFGLLANRPTTTAAGDKAMYVATDQDGGTLYQVQSGAWVQAARAVSPPGKVTSALATTTTFSNSTAVNFHWTATSIPAASLSAGVTVLDLDLAGTIDGIATSGGVTGRLYIGSTVVTTWTISSSTTGAQTGKPWNIRAKLFVDTTGASGQVTIISTGDSVSTSGGTTHTPLIVTTAVDLSGGLLFKMASIQVTANAGNSVSAIRGVLQQVA